MADVQHIFVLVMENRSFDHLFDPRPVRLSRSADALPMDITALSSDDAAKLD
ncbi:MULTISPECIES: hypothetical protein [unclassified Caballeronia]|uniref:hypothetical protein n=1 Tax=unclassified Caballeronia TaxID=2646786 RepID=UPI00285DF73F|nr:MULTISPECIES: hypothetical protein [unclassified Caballeronia]MDR5753009.1 hypothetical protein [Caballeronia sp. LZ024]MDR5845093.1 hypothetical protein [Caballeronia sp. LZ031]